MKIKFTALKIKSLKPESKSVEYFDENRNHGEGCLGLRVSPKNKRSWFLMYSVKNKVKRWALGTYPALSLKDARKAANATMSEIAKGHDPMAAKHEYRKSETFDDMWETYLESPRAKNKAAATLKVEKQKYEKILKPAFGDMKVQDIGRKEINKVLDKMAATAPVNANRLHALLSMLFNKVAVQKSWIALNPMAGLDKPGGPEDARQRVLSDEEIKTLWPHLPAYFQLVLLSCQRPGEVLAARHDEIDDGVWTIPPGKSKTKQANMVPLPGQATQLLPIPLKGSPYLFPSNSRTGHLQHTAKTRKRIQEKTGIKGWTAHDLRRTGRTLLARLKVQHHVAERVLNHTVQGIEAVYNVHDYIDEKRRALDKLGQEIDRITGKGEPGKVVKMQRAG